MLSDADFVLIHRRQGPANRLGFALQLCAFRYPGRLIQPGETIPGPMLDFVAAQLGLDGNGVAGYAVTGTTHYRHSSDLQRTLGYRPCSGCALEEIKAWLVARAGSARSTADLAQGCVGEMRARKIIVPGPTTVERMCSAALVTAEEQAIVIIARHLDPAMRGRLSALITETVDGRLSLLAWVRRIEPGRSTADMRRLLDRLDRIEALAIPATILAGVPQRQIDRLAGEGERLYVDDLRKIPADRRFAILAATSVAWRAGVLDAIIETQERILGRIFREAKAACAEALQLGKVPVTDLLSRCRALAASLLIAKEGAKDGNGDLERAVDGSIGWEKLPDLVTALDRVTTKIGADPLDYVAAGHGRVRRYAPRLLRSLRFEGNRVARRLMTQLDLLRASNARGDRCPLTTANAAFAPGPWRRRIVREDGSLDTKLWEIGLMFALRDRLRAGDIWVPGAGRYRDLDEDLVPAATVPACRRLAVPLSADRWLDDRRSRLGRLLAAVGDAADRDDLANAVVHDGVLKLKRLDRAVPEAAASVVAALYRRLPETRITNILLEVDQGTGFTDAFTDLRTGAPARDRKALLTVLLADGLNMGLGKMARACRDYSIWELSRVATWHVRLETYERALAMVVDAQAALPMARLWGGGVTASSDGQFFPSGRHGNALTLINAKYGSEPGTKLYTHVADHYAPFHVTQITATAFEAPYRRPPEHGHGPQGSGALHRHRGLHRPCLCRLLGSWLPVRPPDPQPAR